MRSPARRGCGAPLLLSLTLVFGIGAACGDEPDAATESGRAAGSTTTAMTPGGDATKTGDGRSPSTTSPRGGDGGRGGGSSATIESGSAGEPGGADAGGFTDPETTAPGNTLPLQARIRPSCVERGALVAFEVKTKAGAVVAARIKYPTESFEGLPSETGDAGSDGRFTWRFRIPADAAEAGEGPAKLLVAVNERDRSGRAQGNFAFTIDAPGGCGAGN